jgi:hypothetical protein
VEEAQEEVYAARRSLNQCESQDDDDDGNSPDCGFEEDQVRDAEKLLAEYEDNLETVKQWRHRIEAQIVDFQNDIHRLSNLASSRTSSAQAVLVHKLEILNRYVGGISSVVGASGLLGQSGNGSIKPDGNISDIAPKPSVDLTDKKTLILKNAEKGRAFQKEIIKDLQTTQTGIREEITVVTKSGTKTRLDAIGKDSVTGQIKISEMKSSKTAPFTKHQKLAHPEIQTSGATVVGKGKDGYEGGTEIPPTKIDVIRPE